MSQGVWNEVGGGAGAGGGRVGGQRVFFIEFVELEIKYDLGSCHWHTKPVQVLKCS